MTTESDSLEPAVSLPATHLKKMIELLNEMSAMLQSALSNQPIATSAPIPTSTSAPIPTSTSAPIPTSTSAPIPTTVPIATSTVLCGFPNCPNVATTNGPFSSERKDKKKIRERHQDTVRRSKAVSDPAERQAILPESYLHRGEQKIRERHLDTVRRSKDVSDPAERQAILQKSVIYRRWQKAAQKKMKRVREDTAYFMAEIMARNWRKNHRFSRGEWNEKLQAFYPSIRASHYFLLRLCVARHEGRRFVVHDPADVHQEPTDEQLEGLIAEVLEHAGSITGAETLRKLTFLAESGWDQASADQKYPHLHGDDVGQEWVLDGLGWNYFKNDKSPQELDDAILELRRSNFAE
ncbi:hypothetical protein HDU80_011796 [Chytriomyces hyalinus]|nr:hypothetical protein HDU80_011796 [Chytriomyces hyalinus]